MLCNGYLFNTGDQAEHLPQVYQKLNPLLYPKDFFLNYYNQTFTVRYFFVQLVYVFSLFISVSAACFLLYFICLYFAIAGIYFLINLFIQNEIKSWVGVISYLFVFRHITVGGNYIQDNIFVGSSIAEAVCIWAFINLFKNRFLLSGLLCGLAALFQPLIGIQVAIIITGILLTKHLLFKNNMIPFKSILLFEFSFLVISLFIIVPVLFIQTNPNHLNQTEANKILFEYRGALHYLPQLFPLKDYLLSLLFLIITLITLKIVTKEMSIIYYTIASIILGLCVLFAIVLVINPSNSLGKIQWFKTTVWLGLFNTIFIVSHSNEKHSKIFLKALSVFTIFTVCVMGYFNYSNNKLHFIKHQNLLSEVHEWIRNNTPTNSLFLTAPNNYSFNCEAQRSTAINYKAIVHQTAYLLAWKQGMEKYYKLDFNNIEKLNCLPSAVKNFNAINFKTYPNSEIDFILLNKNSIAKNQYNSNQICFENSDYIVLKMK